MQRGVTSASSGHISYPQSTPLRTVAPVQKSFQQFVLQALAAAALVAGSVTAHANTPSAGPAPIAGPSVPAADLTLLTDDARYVRDWALESGDTRQQPFAVVDKKAARIFVFDAEGHLLGDSNVLLGQGLGDHSVPGVADGDVNRIPIADRTTPAGRFASQPGRNLEGDANVWFDYQAALAIHRVRPGAGHARRMASLATPTPADNRASLGCVVVTPGFYDDVIAPTLGQRRGVVYVLPERLPVRALFGPSATLAGTPVTRP